MRSAPAAVCFVLSLLLVAAAEDAASFFPREGWRERPDVAASPQEALPGGVFREAVGPSPKSLNYYLDANVMSARIFGLLYETLLSRDGGTLEETPMLASRWSISADKRVFTFWIDPQARWSDGQPVTAKDVLWTWQAVLDERNLTGPFKLGLERFEKPELLPDGGIRFRARDVHWENLNTLGGFAVLPAHVFAGRDFNLVNFDFPVCSGPYRIAEFREGQHLVLKKREDWWRRAYPAAQGVYNFDEIRLRFFEDQQNAFDAFMRGELEQFVVYSAAQWQNLEERYSAVRNNWVVKSAVYNRQPTGMQGFAMNLRRPLFADVRVRRAMAHLLDRRTLNHAMMYDQYFLHRSYWEDLYDEEHPNPNPEYSYDVGKARSLLAEAGWQVNPATGLLMKDGRNFEFTFLNRGGYDKFLSFYRESLRQVGIVMHIVNKDWSAWAKDMDEFNFDMTWAAWSTGIFKDPQGAWSSAEAERRGSVNITGFKNAAVDALIEQQKTVFDLAARNDILRRIDALIYAEVPYVLLWNINYTRVLRWNRLGTPPGIFGKYGGDSGSALWWNDPDLADELTDAMNTRTPLPAEEPQNRYFK